MELSESLSSNNWTLWYTSRDKSSDKSDLSKIFVFVLLDVLTEISRIGEDAVEDNVFNSIFNRQSLSEKCTDGETYWKISPLDFEE